MHYSMIFDPCVVNIAIHVPSRVYQISIHSHLHLPTADHEICPWHPIPINPVDLHPSIDCPSNLRLVACSASTNVKHPFGSPQGLTAAYEYSYSEHATNPSCLPSSSWQLHRVRRHRPIQDVYLRVSLSSTATPTHAFIKTFQFLYRRSQADLMLGPSTCRSRGANPPFATKRDIPTQYDFGSRININRFSRHRTNSPPPLDRKHAR